MAEKGGTTSSSVGRNRKPTFQTGKPKLKPTISAPSRNLLPSKLLMGNAPPFPPGVSSKPKSVNPNTSSSSTLLQGSSAVSQVRTVRDVDRFDNAYDLYLHSLLTNILLEETQELQHLVNADRLAHKCVEIASSNKKINKIFADQVVLDSFDNLSQLSVLTSVFDDILDFTGEETLVEIQTIFSKKFEKIAIEGATVSQPLFCSTEIEDLVNILKAGRNTNHTEEFVGFCFSFAKSLRNLTVQSKFTDRANLELQTANKVLLENLSLTICCNITQSGIGNLNDG